MRSLPDDSDAGQAFLGNGSSDEPAAYPYFNHETLGHAAERLRTIAHPHRLRMIQMLLRDRYTVGELAEACGIKSHMASEHLRLMQRCGLLTFERDGRKTYYAVCDPQLRQIMDCVAPGEGAVESSGSDSAP